MKKPARFQFSAAILFVLSLSLTAWSEPRRANSDEAVHSGHVDGGYINRVREWSQAWENNLLNKLVGSNPGLRRFEEFNMESYLKSREYRSWFEMQNRVFHRFDNSGETVSAQTKLLTDPQQALAAKLLAIRQAKWTVDFAYYIVRNDQTGLAVFAELKEALRRGVSIRMLIDSTGSVGMSPHTELRALIDFAANSAGYVRDLKGQPTMRRATIEVVIFNPITSAAEGVMGEISRKFMAQFESWIPGQRVDPVAYSLNRRSHDKILLIDGAFSANAIAFIGGRNISNDYYGVPHVNEHTYVDFEVMMKGVQFNGKGYTETLGGQVSDYFDQIYYHLGNRVLTRSLLGLVRGYDRHFNRMDAALAETERNLGIQKDSDTLRQQLMELGFAEHKVDIVTTIHNLYRPNASATEEVPDLELEIKNGRALMAKLEVMVPQENKEIVIVSPYLWMSARQIRQLKGWLLQDPARTLTIVTNSVMTSDNIPAQILVDNVIGPALALDPGTPATATTPAIRSVSSQVRIYQYGKLDAKDLGGTVGYGKLHAKGMLLRGANVSIIGTFNNDPRSLLLNSEGAAMIQGAEMAAQFGQEIDRLIRDSHLWGSVEYHSIRRHENLGLAKRKAAENSALLYDMMIKMNIWWLI